MICMLKAYKKHLDKFQVVFYWDIVGQSIFIVFLGHLNHIYSRNRTYELWSKIDVREFSFNLLLVMVFNPILTGIFFSYIYF